MAVGDQSITLQEGSGSKEFAIDVDTKVFRQGARKTDTEYMRELEEFSNVQKNAVGSSQTFIAPAPFKKEPIQFSDVVVGDIVQLTRGETQDGARLVEIMVMQKPVQ